MSFACAAPDAELPLLEGRRRRLEKLRWQLRVARRAVGAKRKQRAEFGDVSPAHGLDLAVVLGFFAGCGAASLLTYVATRWVLS
ncbi:MAG: hypothetical protein SF187_02990 [Deltaproteobacteria bacterium]|nr:hypothetical protein [Deltaproteobacteria bacterium]